MRSARVPSVDVLSSWSVCVDRRGRLWRASPLGKQRRLWNLWSRARCATGRRRGSAWPGSSSRCSSPCSCSSLLVTSVVSVRQSDAEFSDDPRRPAAGRRREPREHRGRAAPRSRPGDRSRDSLASTPSRRSDNFRRQRRLHRPARRDDRRRHRPGRSDEPDRPLGQRRRRGPALDRRRRRSRDGARSRRRSPVITDDGEQVGHRRWSPRHYPSLARAAARGGARPAVVPRRSAWRSGVAGSWLLARLIKRRTRGLRAGRDRGPRRPARGAAALASARASSRSAPTAGDGDERQRARAARPPGRRRGPPAGRLRSAPSVRDVLLDDSDVRDAVLDGRRPGAWCSTATGSIHERRQVGTVATLRDRTELLSMQSELNARESRHPHPARADPRVQQPAAHDLRAAPARGVRRGRARDRRADPPPGRDQRRRDRPGRRPVRGRAADREGQPGGRARHRPAARRRQRAPRLDHELSADVGTVLGNLVDNAVDAAAGAGGTRVDVDLALDDDTVLVQVADSGPGVPADCARSSSAATPPSRATRAAGASGWRSCRSCASVAAVRCRSTTPTAPCSRRGSRDALERHDRDDAHRAGRRRRLHGRVASTPASSSGPRASGWSGSPRPARPPSPRSRGSHPTWSCSTCTCPTSAASTCCAGSAARATTSA